MKLVYIVDDDFDTVNSISRWLRLRKFAVKGFSGSVPLYEALANETPDAILLDVMLKDEDGRDVCRKIRQDYSNTIPVILFSMVFDSIKDFKKTGANDFVRKDISLWELTGLLKTHMKVEE